MNTLKSYPTFREPTVADVIEMQNQQLESIANLVLKFYALEDRVSQCESRLKNLRNN